MAEIIGGSSVTGAGDSAADTTIPATGTPGALVGYDASGDLAVSEALAAKVDSLIAEDSVGSASMSTGAATVVDGLNTAQLLADSLTMNEVEISKAQLAGVEAGNPSLADPVAKISDLPTDISGNAATATKLETARTVGGSSFDGTASVEVVRTVITEVIKSATGSLAASECYGTVINNYGQGAASTLTLPAAVVGLSFMLLVSTTGNALHIKAGAGDKLYLDGTALDDGDKVSLATPAVGNCATFFTFQTGASAYDWYCNTINGVFTDGGA